MTRRRISVMVLMVVLVFAGCRDRLPPEGPSEEEILKAMHEDLFVKHKIADFMITDHDGIDLLAERLSKDPVATSQLFESLARKGGGPKAIAVACLRAAEWQQQNARPVPPSSTAGAQELQRQPPGGKE